MFLVKVKGRRNRRGREEKRLMRRGRSRGREKRWTGKKMRS